MTVTAIKHVNDLLNQRSNWGGTDIDRHPNIPKIEDVLVTSYHVRVNGLFYDQFIYSRGKSKTEILALRSRSKHPGFLAPSSGIFRNFDAICHSSTT